jgi:hypothetical protein
MEIIDDKENALQAGEQVNGVVTEKWREQGQWKEKILRKGVEYQWQLEKEEPKISTPDSTLSKNIGMIKKEINQKGAVQF